MGSIFKDWRTAYFPWPERLCICLAVLLAYSSVWPNEFVFDDVNLIVYNVLLQRWDSFSAFLASQGFMQGAQAGVFYRPVPMLLHFLLYQAFGLSTVAFHALNIALQMLNACLLHYFALRAGFNKGVAFAAALLWAVHPLHTEAVAYMAATPELLWSTFSLLGLIVLLPDFAPRKMGLAALFFVLALGSKGSAAVFPALAVITLFFVSKDRAQFSTYLKTWPLWLLAIGYIAALIIFLQVTGYTISTAENQEFLQDYTHNFINRILTCLATLPVYARLIVWPEGLHMEWNFPVFTTLLRGLPAAGALMACAGLAQILWGRARRGLALSFGLLWFAAALFPATGIIFPVNALISEHWLYLPLMGLSLGAVQTATGLFEKKKYVAQALVLAMVFSLGAATFLQNEKWRNAETVYQNVVQNGGVPFRVTNHLGTFYLRRGEFDKAIAFARHTLDHPDGRPALLWVEPYMLHALALLQVQPDEDGMVSSVEDIARFVRSSPHVPEAIEQINKALEVNPDFLVAHQYLAVIYRHQGNDALAEFHEKQIESIFKKRAR